MNFVPSSFVLAIIAFLILYYLLNKYAFGPLFNVMEQRKERVLGELQNAEQARKQAEQYINEQREALQQARKEAYDIIEQSKTTSSKQAEDMINQARDEANRLKEAALRDIESEKNKAVAALRSEVSDMSVMIASKIIEQKIDEKSQEELVQKFLKEAEDGGKL